MNRSHFGSSALRFLAAFCALELWCISFVDFMFSSVIFCLCRQRRHAPAGGGHRGGAAAAIAKSALPRGSHAKR